MNTDNPQQTVSDLERGWLAGIIEGEGSIVLTLTKQHAKRIAGVPMRVDPRVIITNTDGVLIEKCLSVINRLGVGGWVVHTRPNNVGLVKRPSKDITYIYIQGFKRVHKLLKEISPCFFGAKKERCDVLMRFMSKRLSTGGRGKVYDDEDVGLMLEFLRLSKTKNYEKIAGMLNEHTRDARKGPRSTEWHDKWRVGVEASISRRCALDLRETVRADGNDQPPA